MRKAGFVYFGVGTDLEFNGGKGGCVVDRQAKRFDAETKTTFSVSYSWMPLRLGQIFGPNMDNIWSILGLYLVNACIYSSAW